jgi:Stage II sporulation protein E (SpoIIE)
VTAAAGTQPALRRLLDDPRLAPSIVRLLESAAALLPGVRVALTSPTGSELIARGADRRTDVPSASRAIQLDAGSAGFVAVSGDAALRDREGVAGVVAAAVEVVLAGLATTASRATPATSDAERVHAERLEHELVIGRRIQRQLMPRRFPALPGWEIAAAYDAAREVGGDLYDAFLLRGQPGSLGIVVADVTGKGIPAALVMADVRALLHAAADHGGGPAVTLRRVNTILVHERDAGLFVTIAHGLIDAATGHLDLASAGHEPVLVLRAGGTIDVLEPAGRLVGMVEEIGSEVLADQLEPGDALVAYTDGITEARAPDGRFYGEDRLRTVVSGASGGSAAEIVDAILADVTSFRDGAEASDDLTVLVVRRRRTGEPSGPGTTAVTDLDGDADVRLEVASA